MTQPMLLLSPKFKDFLRVDTDREFLEGVTACGKTTVGIFKFMCKVAASDIRFHVIAGADLGTVEKNVINGERMLLDQFEKVANYHPSGKGKIRLPHIEYKTNKGIKIVYICGYDNKKRWQKVLGGQVGCVYVDEVNIADMEFLREISHRCVYMMTTSNPDDPSLPVYDEFLNRSRPIKRYRKDYPEELLDMLNQPAEKGWIHWYFNFNDNAALTQEAIERKKRQWHLVRKCIRIRFLAYVVVLQGLYFRISVEKRMSYQKLMRKSLCIGILVPVWIRHIQLIAQIRSHCYFWASQRAGKSLYLMRKFITTQILTYR